MTGGRTGTTTPTDRRHALVETAIGWCGVAWSPAGVVAVQLPEHDRTATERRLQRRVGPTVAAEPHGVAAVAVGGIVTLLATGAADLTAVALDLGEVPVFEAAVYAVVRAIPPGATRTYGEVAAAVGAAGAARAVGQAMGRNPVPLIVPCHRVLAAHGAMGGFSAHGGVVTKRRLLFLEGALASEPQSLFDA